jgi:uncharacterized protein YaiI (UPF0178 family)
MEFLIASIVAGAWPPIWLLTNKKAGSARCLARGARVLAPTDREFTDGSIGHSLATRALLDVLRHSGEVTGVTASFAKADRSRFFAEFDEAVHAARRDLKARRGLHR